MGKICIHIFLYWLLNQHVWFVSVFFFFWQNLAVHLLRAITPPEREEARKAHQSNSLKFPAHLEDSTCCQWTVCPLQSQFALNRLTLGRTCSNLPFNLTIKWGSLPGWKTVCGGGALPLGKLLIVAQSMKCKIRSTLLQGSFPTSRLGHVGILVKFFTLPAW